MGPRCGARSQDARPSARREWFSRSSCAMDRRRDCRSASVLEPSMAATYDSACFQSALALRSALWPLVVNTMCRTRRSGCPPTRATMPSRSSGRSPCPSPDRSITMAAASSLNVGGLSPRLSISTSSAYCVIVRPVGAKAPSYSCDRRRDALRSKVALHRQASRADLPLSSRTLGRFDPTGAASTTSCPRMQGTLSRGPARVRGAERSQQRHTQVAYKSGHGVSDTHRAPFAGNLDRSERQTGAASGKTEVATAQPQPP
jgi:hypothetical protein